MTSDRTQYQTPGDRQRASRLSQQPTVPPTEIPGYEPQRFLGSGAYGEVWVARDKNTGRQVAIKFFAHRAGLDWSLLSSEVEKLVFLSADRYVVQLLDVNWDADPPYYVMEYLENGSLDEFLQQNGKLPIAEAVELFQEVAIGLSHAHGKGILHCDLKPANILLDQDRIPRLADFGQSRLATEQRPALGTLFYMAPEQADMNAVPDARWDVYALGAVLYCMLTGSPPYRCNEAVSEIDSTPSLSLRLEKYRNFIHTQPRAAEHRKVRGIDRALVELIHRCLSVDPEKRFPNVQSVLESLHQRALARHRRPLQILGIVGPMLLMMAVGTFAFRAYERAIAQSERLAISTTQQANRFAAKGEAKVVANAIEQQLLGIQETARDPTLVEILLAIRNDPKLAKDLERIANPSTPPQIAEGIRRVEFKTAAARQPLAEYLTGLKDRMARRGISANSWLVLDQRGIMLAAAFDEDAVKSPEGESYAYRSYFHGGDRDLPQGTRDLSPLAGPRLSATFKSTATETYKVALSAPIQAEGETLGVLAMTFELGAFITLQPTKDLCAVLIDGRDNDNHGIVLQHPLFQSLLKQLSPKPLPFDISQPEYRANVKALRQPDVLLVEDPIARHPAGAAYRGSWIVDPAPVMIRRFDEKGALTVEDTGLLLVVQQRLSATVEPVSRLGSVLFREGVRALTVVIAVLVSLWYFAMRTTPDSSSVIGRIREEGDPSESVHSRETLKMPHRR